MPRPAIRTLTFALAVSLVILGASCSGGGGGGGGGGGPPTSGQIRATIAVVDTTELAQFGLVGVTYTVSGPPSAVYNVAHQYTFGSASAAASQVPQGLANTAGGTVGQIQTMNRVLPAGGGGGGDVTSAPIIFWWYAYADLGFMSGTVSFQVTPTSTGLLSVPSSAFGNINYPGAPSQASSGSSGAGAGSSGTGAPAGSTGGRAGHTATAVRGGSAPNSSGLNVLVAGGYTDATSPNAFDTTDRFEFDGNAFTHSVAFSGSMIPGSIQRAHHASAFFIDPSNGSIKVLITGGVDDGDLANATTEHDTGNIYCFSPTEQVVATPAMVGGSRVDHTACWVPCNQVIIIGGTSQGVALDTIEHYIPDASSGTFMVRQNSLSQDATLDVARSNHECALLADGRVFIAGGHDGAVLPAVPGALMCEIYDPLSGDVITLTETYSSMMRVDHTVTRMANGWILIVGGRSPATGALNNTATVFKPEVGTFEEITLLEARALHTATLLGDKSVLVTGGEVPTLTGTGFTASAQVFSVDGAWPAGFTTVTIFDALNEARGEHTATATDQGSVFVIGGRNDVGGPLNFLDSIEFFAFSNDVPAVANAMTAVSAKPSTVTPGATMNITVDVTDADQDGGYVIIRYRELPNGLCRSATIICQSPSTASVADYPNMMVTPGSFTFTWDYSADGVATGADVEIEITPVGAVIGSPLLLVGKAQ